MAVLSLWNPEGPGEAPKARLGCPGLKGILGEDRALSPVLPKFKSTLSPRDSDP